MTILDSDLSVTRRVVLHGAGSVTLAGLGIAAMGPSAVFAAANDKYPDDAFKQKNDKQAIKLLYGRTAEPSDKIKLDAPEIAENGAVVPISPTTPRSLSSFRKTRMCWRRITRSRKARCRTCPIGSKWPRPAMSL